MAENRVIGQGGALPWCLPADMEHFQRTTAGHSVVMGRKTLDTLTRALPGRRNVILTRQSRYTQEGVEVAHSLAEALQLVRDESEIFIAGGGEIYAEALPRADRLYLTVVHKDATGDVFFPEVDWSQWVLREEQGHQADESHAVPFSFRLYLRADR